MRLARIAHPEGMAFVAVDGPVEDSGPERSPTIRSATRPSPAGVWAIDQVRLLAPILPSKVIGIGRNYAEHATSWATRSLTSRRSSSSRLHR